MATKAKPKKPPVGRGPVGYTTSNVFKAPLKKVWEAATVGKHLTKHFIDDCKGEFGPKLQPVTWTWNQYGSFTIKPIKYVKYKEIVWHGQSMGGNYLVTIRFEFVRKGGKTIFRVHESGYPTRDLKVAFMMCEGWTEFHTGVKAYVAFGKDLRKG